MTSDIEIINGHTYLVERDDQGNIIAQIGRDAITLARPLLAKAAALIPPLLTGTATPLQQQQALAALLALQLGHSDLS